MGLSTMSMVQIVVEHADYMWETRDGESKENSPMEPVNSKRTQWPLMASRRHGQEDMSWHSDSIEQRKITCLESFTFNVEIHWPDTINSNPLHFGSRWLSSTIACSGPVHCLYDKHRKIAWQISHGNGPRHNNQTPWWTQLAASERHFHGFVESMPEKQTRCCQFPTITGKQRLKSQRESELPKDRTDKLKDRTYKLKAIGRL